MQTFFLAQNTETQKAPVSLLHMWKNETGAMQRAALGLVHAAKLLHELLGANNDSLASRLDELARIVTLALLILASLNILANGLGIDNLKVGVDVDLQKRQERWPF